jgi:DNA-binding transcriptional MocR family regulator
LFTPSIADKEFATRAHEHGLSVSGLSRTYRSSEPQRGIVLGFGALATADVPEAVRILMDCLER